MLIQPWNISYHILYDNTSFNRQEMKIFLRCEGRKQNIESLISYKGRDTY